MLSREVEDDETTSAVLHALSRWAEATSHATFDGMTHGHPNILAGSRRSRDRADLNNSHAPQNGVAQGPLFREVGARPDVPEASSSKKATRKCGVQELTVKGQALKKKPKSTQEMMPNLT